MASWRPPGSILKASGLHFGGSGPHFRRLWTSYLEPRTPRTPKNLQKQKLHHKVARPPKGGWAAVTPPGGFNGIRRPPKVCQQRARFISNWLCPITAGQSRHSFEQFVRAIRSEVFFPLSFPFPRSLGTTANPTPKSGKVWFFRIFGRFFRLPNRA